MGKYRVTRTLGTGGMGSVIAAHHLLLDQPIAIKCLSPTALDSPAVIERFTREARAAARIASEHVARVIDIGEFENGLPFIVMEYLEGEDLADYIAHSGQVRVSTAVRFTLEACEVLAEAHAAGIVHRDIKPANLFVATQRDKRKIIKVLDFGISKVRDEQLTNASAMLGTLRYMSPEQLKSAKDVDHRTDIWALGAVLYEMLAGVPPFDDDNGAMLIAAVFENRRAPLAELRAEIPEGLAAVVERCLKSDPAERYATVLEMASDLAPFAKETDRVSLDTIRRVLTTHSMMPPASSGAPSSDGPVRARDAPPTVVSVDADADENTKTVAARRDWSDNGGPPPEGSANEASRPESASRAKMPEAPAGGVGKPSTPREKVAPKADESQKRKAHRAEGDARPSSSSQKVATKEASSSRRMKSGDKVSSSGRLPAAKDPSGRRDDSEPIVARARSRKPDPSKQTSIVRFVIVALVSATVFALIGTMIARVFDPPPPPEQQPTAPSGSAPMPNVLH